MNAIPERARPAAATGFAALILLIAAIGWADYATGPQIGFSLFYIIPVTIAAWFFGRTAAATAAIVAAACWLIADLAWFDGKSWGIEIWNGLTRLVLYQMIALLVSRARRDHDRLTSLNRRLQEALSKEAQLARTDPLTGLANPRRFMEHLQADVDRCLAETVPLCVAYLDLDNFKAVNDHYGHLAGDDLLRTIGKRISESIRAGDTPARLGGDEFGIVFRNVGRTEVEMIAARLIDRIGNEGRAYPLSDLGVSIGLAWLESPPADAERIVRIADHAMYRSKADGKGRMTICLSETDVAS